MATVTGLETLLGSLGLDTPVPQFPSADVLSKPIDVFRGYLADLLGSRLGLDATTIYAAIASTSDVTLGDLDVIIPRLKLKVEDVQREFKSNKPVSPLFGTFLVDGVHIRCFFSARSLPRLLLPYISSRSTAYGQESAMQDGKKPGERRQKVVIEYSSPNIPSEFNDTHLRSTMIGSFVANLYEFMGSDVVRLNYLGDWGKQIGLLAAAWKRYGKEDALEADPVGHLLDIKALIEEDFRPEVVAIKEAKDAKQDPATLESQGIFGERDAFFRKMEEGDADALALWKRFREIALTDLEKAYARMGVRFDEYLSESQVKPETMAEVETILREKSFLEESDGHQIIDFTKHDGAKKGLRSAILRYRNGSTTYLLREVAAVIDRERAFGFDKMIYVVSSRQDQHMAQLFSVLSLMGRSDLCQKLQHVSFGRIPSLGERLQGARTLGSILDQSAQLMREAIAAAVAEANEEEERDSGQAAQPVEVAAVGDIASVSAILDQDMAYRRGTNSTFDPKRMTSFEGYTGLQLQKCHALLTRAVTELQAQVADAEDMEIAYGPLEKEAPAELLRTLAQYPEMTSSAFRSLEPNTVLSYLHRLADAVDRCFSPPDDEDYEDSDDEDGEVAEAAPPTVGELKAILSMYDNTRQVLENGLRLLNIPIVA